MSHFLLTPGHFGCDECLALTRPSVSAGPTLAAGQGWGAAFFLPSGDGCPGSPLCLPWSLPGREGRGPVLLLPGPPLAPPPQGREGCQGRRPPLSPDVRSAGPRCWEAPGWAAPYLHPLSLPSRQLPLLQVRPTGSPRPSAASLFGPQAPGPLPPSPLVSPPGLPCA